MGDLINIKGLTFFSKHGVFAEERALGQKFIINLVLETDLSCVGEEDDLNQGICYKTVIEKTLSFAKHNIFQTIEGLAEHLAHKLLRDYDNLMSLQITVEKPHAAIDAVFENISVTIKRDRLSLCKELDLKTVQHLEKNLEPA